MKNAGTKIAQFVTVLGLLAAGPRIAMAVEAPQAAQARQGAKIYGDAERGQEIVGKWCANCHSTDTVANDRVPSLASLASNPSRTDGVIRAFLMQPHKPMPPLELSTQQIEDIIAFLGTLRRASAKP